MADGKVYLGDEDGDVVILKASKETKDGEPILIAEINMANSVYATPVPAHGALILNNRNTLFSLQTGAGTQ